MLYKPKEKGKFPHCVRSQITRLKLRKIILWLRACSIVMNITYNSHDEVWVNPQAPNMNALKSNRCVPFSQICVFTSVARQCRKSSWSSAFTWYRLLPSQCNWNDKLLFTTKATVNTTLETVSIAEPLQNRQHAPLMLSTLRSKEKRKGGW